MGHNRHGHQAMEPVGDGFGVGLKSMHLVGDISSASGNGVWLCASAVVDGV